MPVIRYMSPGAKFFFLILLIIFCLFITMAVGMAIATPFFGNNLEALMVTDGKIDPSSVPFMKYFQIVSQIGFFIVPVIVFSRLVEGNAMEYLRLAKSPHPVSLFLAVSLFIVSIPAINFFLSLNQGIQLPAFLSEFEKQVQTMEKGAEELTLAFLKTGTFEGFLVNLLMIAILPAIGEELLFRGALTRIFFEWTRNVHVAVIISSLIFTMMHMQFYGLVPRLLLGFMLGYLFVWSGNLWLPMVAHFTNNVIVVIAAYLNESGRIAIDIRDFGSSGSYIIIIGSFLVSIMLFWVIKKREFVPIPQTITEEGASDHEEPLS